MKRVFNLLTPLLGVFVLASISSAQCPTPDGLDGGPCCTAAQPNYPVISAFGTGALDICWKDCDVEAVTDCYARWSLFSTPANSCKTFNMKVRIYGGGAVKWNGRMLMQYSRTWLETDAAGVTKQVWRYLANGDMRPTQAAGPVPCPVPPCVPPIGRARFTGYVDMARDCGTGQREYAWMLTHSCDAIDHRPGFPRAGVYHPERSYTFVGPAAGFAIGPIQPIEIGGNLAEGVRRTPRVPGTILTCEFEEVSDFFIDPIQQLCVCGDAAGGGAPQWVISDFGLAGSCGTSILTSGGPLLPGFMSMGIGSWTIPGKYPGVEILRWNAGNYDYDDPCVGITRNEVFFGVTTMGGHPANQILSSGVGPQLDRVFIDQCNSLRQNTTTMNGRYKSDHIINLNLP